MAEIPRIVRHKSEARSCGRFRANRVGIELDQDGVVHAISLPVKRGVLFYRALRCAQFYRVGNLNNWRVCKKRFHADDSLNSGITKRRNPVIDVIELSQHHPFFPRVAKFFDCLFHALQRAGEAATAFLDYARFVPREFINDRARQDQFRIALANQFLKGGKDRLLLVVLCEIQPNARVDKYPKHARNLALSADSSSNHHVGEAKLRYNRGEMTTK
jgi:hypothetical protein